MSYFNIYKISSANYPEAKPKILVGQEEGNGSIRRLIPNPKHPIPGYALTPIVIARNDPRLRITKLGTFTDCRAAFNAATEVVNSLKLITS